jgi:hypothetical protein
LAYRDVVSVFVIVRVLPPQLDIDITAIKAKTTQKTVHPARFPSRFLDFHSGSTMNGRASQPAVVVVVTTVSSSTTVTV